MFSTWLTFRVPHTETVVWVTTFVVIARPVGDAGHPTGAGTHVTTRGGVQHTCASTFGKATRMTKLTEARIRRVARLRAVPPHRVTHELQN
ncbi:MAG: hypothetical protein KDA60_00805 [Planctomycetales bacterium]|nr:hypothetical protein [Planctomycetales bacterium]